MSAQEISEEIELLALLRVAPAFRAVVYVNDEYPAVCECKSGNPAQPVNVIAWISKAGSARQLLNRAYNAACLQDEAAAKVLPLWYGPRRSTWVLPEHPRAFINKNHKQLSEVGNGGSDCSHREEGTGVRNSLEQAGWRYAILIKMTDPEFDDFLPQSVRDADAMKYAHLVRRGDDGLPVWDDREAVDFVSEITGYSRELSKAWLEWDWP